MDIDEEHPLKRPEWVIRHRSESLPPTSHVKFMSNGDVSTADGEVLGTWEFPPTGNGVRWTVQSSSSSEVFNYFASFYDNYIGGAPKMVKGVVTKGEGWFRPVVATFNARMDEVIEGQ
ncbi:hypothetical protein TrRE_jg3896 [Triparma retinervis]|uniref:Uncharacterized protein n=1 Tax=Triparma retinervis TaxID=2557542 RepID=A0A9W6ZXV3_9STRA|nr:hypothetical protein TrRE_jg3896 [Triparma retinervis]